MAQKISPELESLIQGKPTDIFEVLITIEEDSDPNQLPIDKYKQPMSNIISAKLKGTEILKLKELDQIKSIEKDHEVGII
jgi:hypothetical protein